ncbi:MAG TPA: outer membrane beta-barrel protein [Terriglobales bacterium]|nr:outer membrane beta-barrel protein [Terriglobales bacterium]
MMHLKRAALFAMMLALPWVLHAQAIPNGPATADEIPRYELGLNYNYFHANAPPGQCGCFSLNGGSGTIVVNLTPAWSGVADVAYAHANNVNNTSQNITIINYLFGPRYSRRTSSRFVPYGEALLGGAKENVNFQFDINRNAFGFLVGGGVTTRLKPRIGWTIVEADWVYTRIPNAKNNRQNDVRIATGITFNFGLR